MLAGVFLMAGLSGLALPGMSSFVSEFMVLAGTWSRRAGGGGDRLPRHRARRRLHPADVPAHHDRAGDTDATATHFTTDATAREKWVAAPILAVILLLGFVPNLALNLIEPVTQSTLSHVGVTDPVAPLGEEAK